MIERGHHRPPNPNPRSLSKPNPAAAPAAPARSPLALLLASLAGRARWWRSRRLKRAVRGRGAASAASWRAGEKLGGRWVVVVSGRLPRARRARARAPCCLPASVFRARALLPPPPHPTPAHPGPSPVCPASGRMAGFTTFPPNIPSRPPPPPKGRQERALALSDARSPPLSPSLLSPLFNNLIIIAHHTQVPAPRRAPLRPSPSVFRVHYGAGPLPSDSLPPPLPPPLAL